MYFLTLNSNIRILELFYHKQGAWGGVVVKVLRY